LTRCHSVESLRVSFPLCLKIHSPQSNNLLVLKKRRNVEAGSIDDDVEIPFNWFCFGGVSGNNSMFGILHKVLAQHSAVGFSQGRIEIV
jgi:hypothetical protein